MSPRAQIEAVGVAGSFTNEGASLKPVHRVTANEYNACPGRLGEGRQPFKDHQRFGIIQWCDDIAQARDDDYRVGIQDQTETTGVRLGAPSGPVELAEQSAERGSSSHRTSTHRRLGRQDNPKPKDNGASSTP